MTVLTKLADFNSDDITKAMRSGTLEMVLGPFSCRIKSAENSLFDFLKDTYRDVNFNIGLTDVTDMSINVRPPSWFRTYYKRQVIPDPGFLVPAVPLPATMSSLAFEMGLNLVVALKCCRFVTFHAGVVANENGAVLVSAASGGGKSTLVSALMEEGFRLFSDEFGLLNMETAGLTSYPRPVSLKNESIAVVREFAGSGSLSPTLLNTPKGHMAYRRAREQDILGEQLSDTTKLILFPSFDADGAHQATKISSSEAAMRLIRSSTNYHLLGERAFLALNEMVSNAEAYEISYGSTDESLALVRDLMTRVGL